MSEIIHATSIQNLKRMQGQDTSKEMPTKSTAKGDLLRARNLTVYLNQVLIAIVPDNVIYNTMVLIAIVPNNVIYNTMVLIAIVPNNVIYSTI